MHVILPGRLSAVSDTTAALVILKLCSASFTPTAYTVEFICPVITHHTPLHSDDERL